MAKGKKGKTTEQKARQKLRTLANKIKRAEKELAKNPANRKVQEVLEKLRGGK